MLFGMVTVIQSQVIYSDSHFGTMIPSASFFGQEYIERIGYTLAGDGDVNGDGFDDFLIGTFHNAVMGHDAGAVYLFLGHTYLRWGLDDSVAHADARFLGQQAYDAAGYSVACDGDLDGDGIDDMIIGAPAGNDKVPYMPGRVYIVFGKKQADWGFYSRLFDSGDAIYEGEGNQDLAGLSMAYIGDVNSDGYDDFLVGAPFKDGKYRDMGKAYLILGSSGPWLKTNYLNDADAGFIYEHENAQTGYSVAGIGDVNDDGIPDFAIGAFGSSYLFIVYGKTSVNWGKNFDLENADAILYGSYRYSVEGVGWKVAGGSDLNGDGIADIIASAIHDNDGGTQAGKVYVLFGKSGGWDTQVIGLKDGDASFWGEQEKNQAGWGLAMAGDVDGDGYGDFLVGTYKDDNGPVDGKAYLIKGKSTGWQMDVPLSSVPDYCERDTTGIGYAVSTAGDFDNDGLDDYVISAPFNSDRQQWNGKVYLFTSQQVPYEISGNVKYYHSNKTIPEAILWADTSITAIDTTDDSGIYQLFVKGKHDHTVHIHKQSGEHVGISVTSYDAALIARLAIDLDIRDTINVDAADVNSDGRINMYDAANTLRYAVELSPLADSYAGEWAFIPDSMNYFSVVANYFDQNYIGFVRGDVDISWQHPDSVLPKIKMFQEQVITQPIPRDKEFYVPIAIASSCPIISFDLNINYDQQILEFLRIETTDLIKNFQLVYNNNLNDKLRIGAFSQNQVYMNSTILYLVFKAKNITTHQTEVTINRFQINDFQIDGAIINLIFEDHVQLPNRFQLIQNYPNPFNNLTTIPVFISKEGHVTVVIYNTLGKQIRILLDREVLPGKYQLTWDGKDSYGNYVASGIYICKAYHTTENDKIKIIFMK